MKRLYVLRSALLLLLSVCIFLSASFSVFAIKISDTVLGEDTDYIFGYYTRDIHWSITKSSGILHIEGAGDFYYTHHIERFSEHIKTLQMVSGIVSIQEGAFAGLPFERAELSDRLKRIEANGFKNCDKLTKLVIPASVEYIGKGAFEGCESLERIYIFANDIVIDEGAFPDSLNLKAVYFYGNNIDIRSENGEFSSLISGFRQNGNIIPMLVSLAVVAVVIGAFVVCKRLSKKEVKEKGAQPDQK